jgi:hypothetical protein
VVLSPSSVVPAPLHQLCDQLLALHLLVEYSAETLCGEPDVRLRICRREEPDVSVELLVPDPGTWSSRHWDAVRIQRGYRRMWRGPDQDCSPGEVAAFVEALLDLGATQLPQRFADLG